MSNWRLIPKADVGELDSHFASSALSEAPFIISELGCECWNTFHSDPWPGTPLYGDSLVVLYNASEEMVRIECPTCHTGFMFKRPPQWHPKEQEISTHPETHIESSVVSNDRWTQERLEKVGAWWQKILGLSGWTLEWLLCKYEDMPSAIRENRPDHMIDKAQGEIVHNYELAFAKIFICDITTDPYAHERLYQTDTESVIVHELLHLHFGRIKRHYGAMESHVSPILWSMLETAVTDEEERAINQIEFGLRKTLRCPREVWE